MAAAVILGKLLSDGYKKLSEKKNTARMNTVSAYQPSYVTDALDRVRQDRIDESLAGLKSMQRDIPASMIPKRGPTVAEQVAARKAAKLAARKKKGQEQRKKYEAAGTMAKKMKLLFT